MVASASKLADLREAGPRKALGRGLAALMPGTAAARVQAAGGPSEPAVEGLRMIAIERLEPNPEQPRKRFDAAALDELADSIREQGILQPIVARRVGERYQIVAGERRWRAAQRAGLHEVPVWLREFTDLAVLEAALIENIQRADLDPIEEADAYARLISEHGLKHEDLAKALGKSRVAITNTLRLLKLPRPVLEQLASGALTQGHARALMGLSDEKSTTRLAEEAIKNQWSVREVERRVRMHTAARKSDRKSETREQNGKRSPAEVDIEDRLQKRLGSRVTLKQRQGVGRIEIFFNNLDELDMILERVLHKP